MEITFWKIEKSEIECQIDVQCQAFSKRLKQFVNIEVITVTPYAFVFDRADKNNRKGLATDVNFRYL